MANEKALVIPPEASLTSLLSNLEGYRFSVSRQLGCQKEQVIFVLDSKDYHRTRRLATQEKKYLAIYLLLNQLIRSGVLDVRDFRESYDLSARRDFVTSTRKFVDELNDDRIDNISEDVLQGFIKHHRSDRQISIRQELGDEKETLLASRGSARYTLGRITNGRATTEETNEYTVKMTNRIAAAMYVRDALDDLLDGVDVVGIAIRPGGINALTDAYGEYHSQLRSVSAHDSRHYYTTMSKYRFMNKELQDKVDEIASEISGLESEGVVLPNLEFMKHIRTSYIRKEFKEEDPDDICDHAAKALQEFEEEPIDARKINYLSQQVQYELANQIPWSDSFLAMLDTALSRIPVNVIADNLRASADALRLSNKVKELKEDKYLHSELLIAAATISNPAYHYKKNETFYDISNLIIGLFANPKQSDYEWLQTQRKMNSDFLNTHRWYEIAKRI